MKLIPENLRIDGKSPGKVVAFGIDQQFSTVEYLCMVGGKEQKRTITVPTESVDFVDAPYPCHTFAVKKK